MIGAMAAGPDFTVLAVLVLYRRPLAEAQSWPTLVRWLDGGSGPLRHCLIYDNSPEPDTVDEPLPAGADRIRNPDNGGTAAAYTAALAAAAERGCAWLLLLDQDTAIPPDYLERARAAWARSPQTSVLIPKVRHGDALISPAIITARGAVRPAMTAPRGAIRTAISSGVVVRREALATVLPFPNSIWLDYVDHWMFRRFADEGRVIGDIDAALDHDLSLRSPATLTRARLVNILDAETAFHASRGGTGWLRLRRVVRAARYLLTGHLAHAGVILYRAARAGGR